MKTAFLVDMRFDQQIKISASENQPGCMGRYLLHYDSCNGKPAYKQYGGDNKLYFVAQGTLLDVQSM